MNTVLIIFLFITYSAFAVGDNGVLLDKRNYTLTANYFIENTNCESYQEIKGKQYCVQTSSITLNSCGPSSDWPCMEAQGCLVIDKFTLK
ncbi:MAG: hypothetical protein AAEA78_02860 [Methylophilaceae bacterium]